MDFSNPMDYFRLVSHIFGHASWDHIKANIIIIYILGISLEKICGHTRMFLVILFTAVVTGALYIMFPSKPPISNPNVIVGLLGASGIASAFVLLIPAVCRDGEGIPGEFFIIAPIFIAIEIGNASNPDNVSQMTHIIGGVCGAVFGFATTKVHKRNKNLDTKGVL